VTQVSIERIAVVGGTGPQGRGLALRLAAAGQAVIVGSRERIKAEAAAATVSAAVPGADVRGAENADAVAHADTVVLALAPVGLEPTLAMLRDRLAGRLVVDMVVPLVLQGGRVEHAPPAGAASVGELVQAALPANRVVAAFKTVPASHLLAIERPLDGDVLLCGDDATARADVGRLVARIARLRPVDAGPMCTARYVEGLTALLVTLNRMHHAHTSIRVLGLSD
jgi:hypothetical protein